MTTAKFCIAQRIDCDRVEHAITSIASIVKEHRLTFTFTQEFGSSRRVLLVVTIRVGRF